MVDVQLKVRQDRELLNQAVKALAVARTPEMHVMERIVSTTDQPPHPITLVK